MSQNGTDSINVWITVIFIVGVVILGIIFIPKLTTSAKPDNWVS